MTSSVGDEGDEVHILAFLASQQTVDRLDQYPDEVDVLPFVEATDVVGLSRLSLMENQVDGASVVFHIEPVANVLTLAVDGQRLVMTNVVDEQRDELLGELIGAVVV